MSNEKLLNVLCLARTMLADRGHVTICQALTEAIKDVTLKIAEGQATPPQQELATVAEMRRYGPNGPNRGVPPDAMDHWADILEASEQIARNLAGEAEALQAENARLKKVQAVADRMIGGLDDVAEKLRARIAELEQQAIESEVPISFGQQCYQDRCEKAEAFKAWVHLYLDGQGVPHHPPGIHGSEGCRIGDRMDWLMARIAELESHQPAPSQEVIDGD